MNSMSGEQDRQDERNEQTPINQLPDEILCDIFLLNTQKDGDEENPHSPLATLLSTGEVCRRWHDVASNYPMLWSRIIDFERHHPDFIADLLRRSKTSLFAVGGDSVFKAVQLRDPRAKTVLQSIFEHRLRIQTLSLNIRLAPWEFICQNFLKHPAPTLEYLNLVTSCPFPDCLYAGPLFSDEAPHLQRLHLQRCLIDFSSCALHNLTELSVMDIVAPTILSLRVPDHPLKVAPTVMGWLRVLENMPSLRCLTLSGAISSSPGSEEESMFTVALPHLLFLTVGAKFNDAANFLEHLDVPASCGIRTRLTCNRSASGLARSKLLAFLNRQLTEWRRDAPDRYLQAKILSGDRIHFGNSRRVGYIWDMTEEELIKEHTSNSTDPLLWLVVSFDDSQDTLDFFKLLLSLYEPTYPTTTMLDLWIDEEFAAINNDSTPFPSLDSLQSFTAVKVLNLLGRSPLYLLPLFQSASLLPLLLFPTLRSLRLTRTNFEIDQRATYFAIVGFLLWRLEVHAPIMEVYNLEGRISKETQESLARTGNVRVTHGTMKYGHLENASDEE